MNNSHSALPQLSPKLSLKPLRLCLVSNSRQIRFMKTKGSYQPREGDEGGLKGCAQGTVNTTEQPPGAGTSRWGTVPESSGAAGAGFSELSTAALQILQRATMSRGTPASLNIPVTSRLVLVTVVPSWPRGSTAGHECCLLEAWARATSSFSFPDHASASLPGCWAAPVPTWRNLSQWQHRAPHRGGLGLKQEDAKC